MPHPPQQGIYGDNRRAEVVRFLLDGVTSALDVGCGRGGFGVTLHSRCGRAARLVGVERTHLRYFTRTSWVRLFEEAGFVVESCTRVSSIAKRWATDPFAPRRVAKQGLARVLGDHRYLHFVVVGRPRAL